MAAGHEGQQLSEAAGDEGQQPSEAAGLAKQAPAATQHLQHVTAATPLEQQLEHGLQQEHAPAKAAASPLPPVPQEAAPAEAEQCQLDAAERQPPPPPPLQGDEQQQEEKSSEEQSPEEQISGAPSPEAAATELPGAAAAGGQQEQVQHAPGEAGDPLAEAGSEGEPSTDPADVAPVPLGSPFVPPSLSAPPAVPAIPLFSSFVPPAPAAAASEPGAAPAIDPSGGGAAAPPGDASGSNGDVGSSSEGQAPPRHRRGRSLLSEGLAEQQHPSTAGAGPAEQAAMGEEHRLLAELAGLRQEDGPAAAAPAAAPAGLAGAPLAGPPGRPAGLRVELPAEHAESTMAAAADRLPPPADPAPQQAGPALAPELLPGGGSHPADAPAAIDLQQQQVAAAAAAAAAEYFAVPPQPAPGRSGSGGGGPTPDSVAAALQRAVELAASGSGSLALGPAAGHVAGPGAHGVGFSGFQGPPPAGAFPAAWPAGGLHGFNAPAGGASSAGSGGRVTPAGWPGGPGMAGGAHAHAAAPRGALSGGTFRSATVPAPIGQHGPAGGDSAWGDSFSGYSMLAERSASVNRERHLPRVRLAARCRPCLPRRTAPQLRWPLVAPGQHPEARVQPCWASRPRLRHGGTLAHPRTALPCLSTPQLASPCF